MIRKAALLQVLAGVLAGGGMLMPVASHAGDETTSVIKVDAGAAASTQLLALPVGRSAVIDLPVDARDVLVSNPLIAEAVLRTPRRIYVLGLKSGVTDAMFFDAAGHRLLALNIRVDQNVSALADTINRILPGSQVKVESINDSVILTGTVTSAADADKAVRIAGATVGRPEQVLNMLSIAGEEQVMLKVRIVEMQRSVIKQLGVDWKALINQAGSAQFLLSEATTYGISGSLLGGISASGGYNTANNQVVGNLQAFEREGLVRTLAEPNLTAVSGEPAKFLVGGEFPVPVDQDVTGRVTVAFKDYGVGLGFTPIVLSGGRIQLKLTTEVSELSQQGAFSLASTSGSTAPQLVIPGLNVRRANTTVEMASGGSLMIAGLLEDKSSQDLDALPGIKDLPILGALFRSRDYLSGETELVVIVTPYLVNPVNAGQLQTPADGLQVANDHDTILLGRLNKTFNHESSAPTGRTYQGPYGYVVE
ncbi:MAG TPA: type II and III secretion system protein family protein [Caulobacteraceae bacterium]|nr:type II and III secretion system protein family protein [Caulobacteraceae bacterium]